MLTTEEIVHVYENSLLTSGQFAEDTLAAVYAAGLAALHAQQDAATPLTREELQTMERKPVWIARLNAPEKSRWCLIDGYNRDCLLFRGEYGGYVRWGEMGTIWMAYGKEPR